jgi:hypothetical protein
MNTDGFFAFYNALYTGDNGNEVINALRYRKITLEKWKKDIFKKRRDCEACIFTCFLENDKFKEQLVIYENEFKQSIENYANSHWFDVEYDITKHPRKHLARRYHEIRKRQIELVLKYIEKVRNPKITNLSVSAEPSVDNRPTHYTYTNIDKTITLFNYLVEKGYLLNPSQNDFVYYMTGKGDKLPQKGLCWLKTNVDLSLFIDAFFSNHTKKWHFGEMIFGRKRLASAFGQTEKGNPFKTYFKKFKNNK